jgi:hypothetical protein
MITQAQTTPLVAAAQKIALIYSSDDGACLTPDPQFREQQIMDAWANLRRLIGLADDLK